MTLQNSDCPDQQTLQQFLLGQLSVAEIEGCQQHLSQCNPCVETVENLRVDDTFTELACDVLRENSSELSMHDDQIISQMIAEAQGWTIGNANPGELKVSMDKAAEVQRLVRAPIQSEDLGAIEHFRLRRLIGTGSTGIVYLAIDTKLDRHVVLKVLRPSLGEAARQRFIAEAKATAAIDHPNVVTIYEVGNDGPLSYIAMQWIPGTTLEEKLANDKSLSVQQTRQLAEQIARGLSAAHAQGLIHRDIKPANVWIPHNDEPAKILDFGLVRVNDEDPQLTCTGMIAGTPCFMSPEQSRGDRLDERSDLFSLGCLMYQSLTGRLPFHSDNALATLRSIQQDQPTNPMELDPSIDAETSDLVMCLLSKSPNRRPSSAEILINALNSKAEQWDFELVPAAKASDNRFRTQASIWKFVAALLFGVALAAFGFAYGKQVIRIAMNEGEIKIETKVDDVKIEIIGDGDFVKVIDLATQQSIDIKAGQYEIRALGDGNSISIDKNQLTLSRGEVEVVQITRTESEKDTASGPPEVRVFPLTNADASIVFLTIKSLLGIDESNPYKKITYNTHRNQIVATGNSERLDVIGKLIQEMDHEGKSKPVVQFDPTKPYKLAGGDVLGIFIDGVLGRLDEAPPVHIPDPQTGLSPSLGFPIQIEHDGFINLPFVDSIQANGKTLDELRQSITKAFKGGDQPILKEQARIIVTLFKMRDQRLPLEPHPLESGDVLGVFIDGVLGEFDAAPPFHTSDTYKGATPSLGFPVWVEHDGCITLPHVPRIKVRGMTISEVRTAINKAYKGDTEGSIVNGESALLPAHARILVNMIRHHAKGVNVNIVPANPSIARSDQAASTDFSVPKTNFSGGEISALSATNRDPQSATEEMIRYQIKILEMDKSSLEARLGPQHPEIKAVEKRLQGLNDLLETNSVATDSTSQLPPASTKTEPAQNQINELNNQLLVLRQKADQGLVKSIEVFNTHAKLFQAITRKPDTSLEEKHKVATSFILAAEKELQLLSHAKPSETDVNPDQWQKLLTQRRDAVRLQTRFEREMGLPVSQPVFDGNTYTELLDIAKSERDLAKLNKAIIGLVNLAGKYERDESADAIMQIARRTPGIASSDDKLKFDECIQQYFVTLNLASLTRIFVNELENGTIHSQRHFKRMEYSETRLFYQTFKSRLGDDNQSKQSSTIVAKALTKNLDSKWDTDFAFKFLTRTFSDHWVSLGLNENEDVTRLFESFIVDFKDNETYDAWIPTMWKLAPKTNGLDDVVRRYVDQLNDRLLQSSGISDSSRNSVFARVRKQIVNLDDNPELAETIDFEYTQYQFPELKISDSQVVVNRILDVETLRLGSNLLRSYRQKYDGGYRPEGIRTYLDVKDSLLFVAGPLKSIWKFQSEIQKLAGGEELTIQFPSSRMSKNWWHHQFSSSWIDKFKTDGRLVLENSWDKAVEDFIILPVTNQRNVEYRPIFPEHEYENGTITFRLTDDTLDLLKSRALRHRIQRRFRNQITKVELIYDGAAKSDGDADSKQINPSEDHEEN